MGRSESASTSLAPGFRFHPTDEELVSYYLKRKVCGKPFRFDAISDIDIYKVEPWDLPGLSKLKSRDLEWYFFSGLDRKYGNGSRTNRATCEGYWKTTGKDRPVHHRSRVVGMKKTLVYHQGRAPHGKRTNWVMHEYKLVDEALEKAGFFLDGVVLCRIFQKSGTGPKNGEKYGAPFIEEEWEDENVGALVPGDVSFEPPSVDDDAFIEQNDLDQNLDLQLPGNETSSVNNIQEDINFSVEDFGDITGNEEKTVAGESAYECGLNTLDAQTFFDPSVQVGSSADMVKNEHMAQPSDATASDEVTGNCLSNETFSDLLGDVPQDDELFLDATDFLNSAEANPLDFGPLESFMEDDIDIGEYLSFDSPLGPMASDTDVPFFSKEDLDGATSQLPLASHQLPGEGGDDIASSSQQTMDIPGSKQSKEEMQYPFLGHASRLLGNIHAPPAFASEFPSKDMAARLNALQASSSVHVTAGMIRISGMTAGGSSLQWSFDKTGNVNVLLSFDVPQDVNEASMDSLSGVISSKMTAAVSRGWLRFMFLWFMFLAVSIKVGFCIYAK